MKKLLLILLCLPFIGFGQKTYVPDDIFENYLENNGMGDGVAWNDSVLTANINTVIYLNVPNWSINNLTGIEDFTALERLHCEENQLTSLDVSQNTALEHLFCFSNQITTLDVSANNSLLILQCQYNQLTSLNVIGANALYSLSCHNNLLTSLNLSGFTALEALDCAFNQLTSLNVTGCSVLYFVECLYNQITSLDFSTNTALTSLRCQSNQLTSLDLRNGNNTSFTLFNSYVNPNLYCIDVDNPNWSTTNWTNIDTQQYFSINCPPTSIQEHTTNKELLKVTDLLGREIKGTNNQPLFYIYDDGTVEKRIVIE